MAKKDNPFADPELFCVKKGKPDRVMKANRAVILASKGKLIETDADGKPLGKAKGKAPAKAEKDAPGETEGDAKEPSEREQLEADCKKLGIAFRKGTKDETLRKKIEAARAS